jgi:hypothetical protein
MNGKIHFYFRTPKKWCFFLSNGEKLADLTFFEEEIRMLFPDAKIQGDCVYL